ncbi:MAG: hypothetical protein M3Z75_07525 [Actinomycetota bacterium]|nr:hypothetical protein [Actinomycetota bacterium]
MNAQTHDTVSSPRPAAATLTAPAHWRAPATSKRPSRATLQTRPRIQRALIRSWEYIPPVRVTFLVIRLLAVLWMIVLGAILMSQAIGWGWILLPAAVAVFALSLWVYTTAAKGWPVAEA